MSALIGLSIIFAMIVLWVAVLKAFELIWSAIDRRRSRRTATFNTATNVYSEVKWENLNLSARDTSGE